jgi:uncharacterized protein (DUF1800 family)
MDRRGFLKAMAGPDMQRSRFAAPGLARDLAFRAVANAELPARRALVSGLEPYSGPWTRTEASHLLSRTLAGFRPADLAKSLTLGMAGSVDALMDLPLEPPPPPVSVSTRDTTVAIGQTWVGQPYDSNAAYDRSRGLQAWWFGLFLEQGFSIREKLTLFWHNQFSLEWRDVGDPHHNHRHLSLLRSHCLGSFRDLARKVTLDPAMLRYLNGNTNTKSNPNENYARELLELFTIGKGPEISVGNYTNYTEEDVRAAARVLTGWRDVRNSETPEFRPTQHDATDKTFSSAFGSRVIRGRSGADGALEVDDLVAMVFEQRETARHLCRRLYRFFVYYVLDEATERLVIEPLAELLVANDWQVGPVVETLLKSAHFHDAANRGCFIKTPLDLVVGTLLSLGSTLPPSTDPVIQYQVWTNLLDQASNMQMELLSPPNVAGWPAFHQEPVFYQTWINSDTLPRRVQFSDRCLGTKGYQVGSTYLVPPLLDLATSTADPSDLDVLVTELSWRFLEIPLTPTQIAWLRSVVLNGAPSYEWNRNWVAFTEDPSSTSKRSVVEARLRTLVKTLMGLAEYQLC